MVSEERMNTCVSDGHVVINIQGIRHATWGESIYSSSSEPGKRWFIQVTYKGNRDNFYYRTEAEAYNIFCKIREAMDKTYRDTPNAKSSR